MPLRSQRSASNQYRACVLRSIPAKGIVACPVRGFALLASIGYPLVRLKCGLWAKVGDIVSREMRFLDR
ncbi:MAG: hypothetical protein P8L85_15900 [Rubripirellula sp.]|nr:hypothetical protein [Rubripirellula sp.]